MAASSQAADRAAALEIVGAATPSSDVDLGPFHRLALELVAEAAECVASAPTPAAPTRPGFMADVVVLPDGWSLLVEPPSATVAGIAQCLEAAEASVAGPLVELDARPHVHVQIPFLVDRTPRGRPLVVPVDATRHAFERCEEGAGDWCERVVGLRLNLIATEQPWPEFDDHLPEGTLRIDWPAAKIKGTLRPDQVRPAVDRWAPQLQYCYRRFQVEDPSLAGEMTVQFKIGDDGQVAKAKPRSTTLSSEGAAACVVGRFAQMEFPPPRAGTPRVRVPLVFLASED